MRKNIYVKIFKFFLLGVLCLGALFPFYWMINLSLQTDSINVYPPKLYPRSFSLQSYIGILTSTQKPLVLWLKNSLIVAFASTGISMIFSLFAGYAISKYRFSLNKPFSFLILVTQMLPAPLLLIPMYIIFRRLNIIDTAFGLIVANVAFSMPFCVWMIKSFFDNLPKELEEAAILDGCSRMKAFFKISVPLLIPGIIAVSVFSFLISWEEFFAANTLINSESKWVVAVGISTFIGERVVQWNEIMAASTLVTIPAVIFFLCVQKYLVAGLTAGAVKQ